MRKKSLFNNANIQYGIHNVYKVEYRFSLPHIGHS